MSAKKYLVLAMAATVVASCGTTPSSSSLPGDGTYDSSGGYGDDGYGGDGYGGDSYASPLPDTSYTPAPAASSTPDAALGFTLKGVVLTKETRAPLVGASVSIGSQTMLTDAKGEFEIKDITDTQVWVNVTAEGYDAVSSHQVVFSDTKPAADLEFLLKKKTAIGTTPSPATGPRFTHELAFGGAKKFKSVSAMAVEGDVVYVLGVVDGFLWLNRNSVVAYDAGSGSEIKTFNKTGLFSRIPSDVDSLKVENGELYVSNGESAFVFNGTGTFLRKTSGARYSAIREVVTENSDAIRFKATSGAKIETTVAGATTTLTLDDVGSIKAIGLDAGNNLLALDTTHRVVHKFSFRK